MKKIIFIVLIGLTFYSCSNKEFPEVIEPGITNYQVKTMNNSSTFTYSNDDTVLTAFIGFNSTASISQVSMNAFSSDGNNISGLNRIMFDDGNLINSGDAVKGDGIYSTKVKMDTSMPNGKYRVEYIVTDNYNKKEIAGVYNFTFNNGKANIAPVLSNVSVEPDSVVANDTIPILIRVTAEDLNGLNDIEKVYFVVYRPDGTTNGSEINVLDNGLMSNGDVTAGDGIYSLIIEVNQNNAKGLWRFEFRAKDRGKKYSNIINYNILIQ